MFLRWHAPFWCNRCPWVEPTNEGGAGIYSRLRESSTLDSWRDVSFFGESAPVVQSAQTESGYTIYKVVLPINQSKNFYHLAAEYDRSFAE